MRVQNAAVIGHPIGHTMSPFIHQRLFALEGIPVSYQVLDVPDLPAALPALRELDCFNITIPHKSSILPFLDGLEEKARLFGSVNTVQVKEGKLLGFTTDGAGCYKALENHGCDFSGRVLLLGNGGAAGPWLSRRQPPAGFGLDHRLPGELPAQSGGLGPGGGRLPAPAGG